MPRFGGLFSSSPSSARSSTTSLSALDKFSQLEEAMRATLYIFDDDLEKSEKLLAQGSSAFHKLGLATDSFIQATLGFEPEIMKEASERLAAAETAANESRRRAQRDSRSFRSSIYAPGTEYALCAAEAQIMGAVVGILNESLTEALKGFYNVRKAYMTLNSIVEMERRYAKGRSSVSLGGSGLKNQEKSEDGVAGPQVNGQRDSEDDDSDDFFEVDESRSATGVADTYLGNIEREGQIQATNGVSEQPQDSPRAASTPLRPTTADSTFDASELTNSIDIFIHSGASLFFGILQLTLSLVPPTFSKLLSIIGFRGDSEYGMQLLWRSAAYDNINGALGGIIILSYYTGLVALLDIRSPSDSEAFPKERCKALIHEMRTRHPTSHLGVMQEMRMLASERQLQRALDVIAAAPPSALRQVSALSGFENSLNNLYMHRYQACADGFLRCVELNNWSHALYYYIAGSAHVELYRSYTYGPSPNPTKAAHHAATATTLLLQAPSHASKKRFLSRQLPFDVFVARKLAKWTARAAAWQVPLVDAVGVSPCEEMAFFWGGYSRKGKRELERSLKRLAWSDGEVVEGGAARPNPHWGRESIDEHATLALLRAAANRQLGDTARAKELLAKGIVEPYRWEEFKGVPNGDTWPAPVARYEMAVCYWMETAEGRRSSVVSEGLVSVAPANGGGDETRGGQSNAAKLKECGRWLEKVATWPDKYDLETRFGTRISAGRETLKKMGVAAG